MDNQSLQPSPRKWYQKKRYIIPLLLFTFLIFIGSFDDSNPSSNSYAPATEQVESINPLATPLSEIETEQPVFIEYPAQNEPQTVSPRVVFPSKTTNSTVKTSEPVLYEEVPLSNNNTYINSQGNEVHSPAYAPSIPPGATAICRDGTYSFSQSRRGTCSHHGGVAQWL